MNGHRRSLECLETRRLLTRLFDIDADGDFDVLQGLTWFENVDGFGNFVAREIAEGEFNSIAADVDNDGDLDVVSDKPQWFENVGNRFIPHQLAAVDQAIIYIELQDVGMDGDWDLVAVAADAAYVFKDVGSLGVDVPPERYLLPTDTQDVADFDGFDG